MHVQHRRIVERHADRLQLRGKRAREPLRQSDVAAAPESRHGRPFCKRPFQAGDASTLLVDRHPDRQVGHEPRGVEGQLRHLLGLSDIARKEDHAAQPEFLRERSQLRRNLMTVEAGDQQLANLASEGTW